MIKKAKLIWKVFWSAIINDLRVSHIREKSFIGRYIDIEIERRRWADKTGCIITGEKHLRNAGGRKIHQQIVFYVPGTFISKWLGFKKGEPHYRLAGWYDKKTGSLLAVVKQKKPRVRNVKIDQ